MAQFQRDPSSFGAYYDRVIGARGESAPGRGGGRRLGSAVHTWSQNYMAFTGTDRPVPAPGDLPSASSHT